MKLRETLMALSLLCFSAAQASASGLDLERFRLATREYSFLLGLKTSGVLLSTERLRGYGSSDGEFFLRTNLIKRLAADLTAQLHHFSNPYLVNELRQIIADLESAGSQSMSGGAETSVRLQLTLCKRITERLNGLADLAATEYQKNANAVGEFIEAAAQSPEKLTPELKRALIQATRQVEDERLVSEQTLLKLQTHLREAESQLAERQSSITKFDQEMSAREAKHAESESALTALKQQLDQTLQKLSADQEALKLSQEQVNRAMHDVDAAILERKQAFEAKIPELSRAAIEMQSSGKVETRFEGLDQLDEKTSRTTMRGITSDIYNRIQEFKAARKVPLKANITVTTVFRGDEHLKKGLFVESVDHLITLAMRVRVQQGIHAAEQELSTIQVLITENAFQFSKLSLLSIESDFHTTLSRMVDDAEVAALNTQSLEDALCKVLLRTEKP